jgi:hypothetical protein
MLASACASDPPKVQELGQVVAAPEAPKATPPALMSPPSFSFQTRLQQIFDSSLSKPTASATNTPPATGGQPGR